MTVDYIDWEYAYCTSLLLDRGLDLERENRPALERARRIHKTHGMPFDAVIVPGYTPLDQRVPTPGVHALGRERVLRAAVEWDDGLAPFIILSGGYVYPDDNPFNEALEMKKLLVAGGLPEDAVLIEPCARHSHTNIRNVGRLMLSAGLVNGLVVTSYDQAYYLLNHYRSGFSARCWRDFGHLLGRFRKYTPHSTAFYPYAAVFEVGREPLDP